MIYVVIKNLPHLLKTNNPLKLIEDALVNAKPKLVFLNEEKAGHYIESELNFLNHELRQGTSYGLVVLNTDKDTFTAIKSKPKQLMEAVNGLVVKGKRIDAQMIEADQHEKQQLVEMNYPGMKPHDMLLTEPYPCSLLKMPRELWFLGFIDYALFYHYLENWVAYNAREPRSVLDLFNTQANICNSIFLAQNPEPLSLEHVRELQASLSSSLFSAETKSKSGELRDGYNSFPINRDAINVKGAVELLKRIKNDNDENGFMIGEVKHFEIVHQYCKQLSFMAGDCYFKRKNPVPFQEYSTIVTGVKAAALQETIKKVTQLHPHVSADAVEHIIDSFLKENKFDEQFLNRDKYTSWGLIDTLSVYIGQLAGKAQLIPTKDEMAFALAVARQKATINHATLKNKTDEELQTIAEQLVTSVKDNSVSLLTPDPVSAEKKAKIAINQYNLDVSKTKTPDEVILCIVTLVHELEILHVFHDVNCRTNYFLLNEELIKHGLKPTILYNPNRLDGYSVEDLVEQVKQGMHRYDYVKANAGELVKINDSFLANNKSSQSYYEKISSQLNDVLMKLTHQYQESIGTLGKIISNTATTAPGMFSSSVNTAMIDEIKKLFNQFSKDQNLLQFISALNQMSKSEMHLVMGKEFVEELSRLTVFSHMNCDFHQSMFIEKADKNFTIQ
ncbi:hypothetical protein [Legionella maioricensis]|uniref:Fido domain-containing protein n=1 Tax=Legionella maioricensis TaxID=2896528 RepID=A0A9X2IAR6_9GAMM|nr:hypothetical protein [Legionella maioricensis]MCL9683601.1 hypothetical protein [Legionella maioricensis]MCL9687623.1 hypothetical protein [Legionella maioricensis]